MANETQKRVATVADRLREAMTAAGKRQVDLVRETGLYSAAICRYLSGEYEPKQSAVYRLAVALDVSELWLWGYDVPRARTDEQKKNDQLAELVARMKNDPAFLATVAKLAAVEEEKRELVDRLLATILN